MVFWPTVRNGRVVDLLGRKSTKRRPGRMSLVQECHVWLKTKPTYSSGMIPKYDYASKVKCVVTRGQDTFMPWGSSNHRLSTNCHGTIMEDTKKDEEENSPTMAEEE